MSENEKIDQEKSTKKIAVLHDAFLYRGGGDRLVTLMAKALDADLVSGFFSEGSFDPRELGFTGKIIPLGKPVFAKGLRHAVLKYRFLKKTKFLSEYDIVIFSGNCLDAVQNVRPDAQKVYYCHTPPRYIFDFRTQYLAKIPSLFHRIANNFLDRLAHTFTEQLDFLDIIFTNSKNTHDRLVHYCHKESIILYPPTDTNRFVPHSFLSEKTISEIPRTVMAGGNRKNQNICSTGIEDMSLKQSIPEEYFLSCSRLTPPKRVDIVIEAFQNMPKKNLVFTYGKNDPEKEKILAMCQGYANIFPIPAPTEDEFISLLSGAIANIYIPIDEDFGMTPVESMSCGVPVIGAREGGLLETILEGKTGKFVDIVNLKSGIANLQKVIEETNILEWKSMKDASRERAGDFSLESFTWNLKKYLKI